MYTNVVNNLPTCCGYDLDDLKGTATALSATINTAHSVNNNLSEPEKELACQHNQLGHIGFQTIQLLMRMGVLAKSEAQ